MLFPSPLPLPGNPLVAPSALRRTVRSGLCQVIAVQRPFTSRLPLLVLAMRVMAGTAIQRRKMRGNYADNGSR